MRRLDVEITDQVELYLKKLLAVGLHGDTIEEVADRLICKGLEEALVDELTQPPRAAGARGKEDVMKPWKVKLGRHLGDSEVRSPDGEILTGVRSVEIGVGTRDGRTIAVLEVWPVEVRGVLDDPADDVDRRRP